MRKRKYSKSMRIFASAVLLLIIAVPSLIIIENIIYDWEGDNNVKVVNKKTSSFVSESQFTLQDIETESSDFDSLDTEVAEDIDTVSCPPDYRETTLPVDFAETYYQFVDISDEELDILSSAVEDIAGDQSDECKSAVAQVFMNRMKYYDCSLKEVIEEPGQFIVSECWFNRQYTEATKVAVNRARFGPVIPATIFFFQKGEYHEFKGCSPWKKIGDYFFSVSTVVLDDYNDSGYFPLGMEKYIDK